MNARRFLHGSLNDTWEIRSRYFAALIGRHLVYTMLQETLAWQPNDVLVQHGWPVCHYRCSSVIFEINTFQNVSLSANWLQNYWFDFEWDILQVVWNLQSETDDLTAWPWTLLCQWLNKHPCFSLHSQLPHERSDLTACIYCQAVDCVFPVKHTKPSPRKTWFRFCLPHDTHVWKENLEYGAWNGWEKFEHAWCCQS